MVINGGQRISNIHLILLLVAVEFGMARVAV
jgi:hypothetical protein